MSILIFFFAVSFLGVVSMLSFKLIMLERQGHAGTHANLPSPHADVLQASGSLDRRFGVFFRAYAKRFSLMVAYLWSQRFFPAFLRSLKILIMVVARIMKKIGSMISSRVDSFGNKGRHQRGAASFFLKDISEHKKNLKNRSGR